MMTDVENGLIGTIIVKDMSRLGRNYLMVGQYTEIIFRNTMFDLWQLAIMWIPQRD